MTDHLQAPWRMDYIRAIEKSGDGECFLCLAAQAANETERRDRLVLWMTELCIVVINRYPYTNGHLLVAPRLHKADFEELTDAEGMDIHHQTARAIAVLRRAQSPQGYNIGINLGRPAGAGLPGHIHQHVVPRWAGDTNFMSVVGDVRIVPQAMSQLYVELLEAAQQVK